MQVGIIAHEISTSKDGTETVQMSLIDYKDHAEKDPQVTICWMRAADKDFSRFAVVSVNAQAHTMGSTGKILQALDRFDKKVLGDPANLLHLLQKQLGRQVVWDHRVGRWTRVGAIKESADSTEWRISSAVDKRVLFSVTAADEDSAKCKALKRMADCASDPAWAKELSTWAVKPAIEKLDGPEGAPPDFVDLAVYSRRSAAKKATK